MMWDQYTWFGTFLYWLWATAKLSPCPVYFWAQMKYIYKQRACGWIHIKVAFGPTLVCLPARVVGIIKLVYTWKALPNIWQWPWGYNEWEPLPLLTDSKCTNSPSQFIEYLKPLRSRIFGKINHTLLWFSCIAFKSLLRNGLPLLGDDCSGLVTTSFPIL